MPHWTQKSIDDFVYRIVSDFVAQLDKYTTDEEQLKLDTQIDRMNLYNIVDEARKHHLKVAIVLYDDDDPENEKGPIYSGKFEEAWIAAGKPRNNFES